MTSNNTCVWCGDDQAPNSEVTEPPAEWFNSVDGVICESCNDESFDCHDCGNRAHVDDSTWVNILNESICYGCANSGRYFYCEGCMELLPNSFYGGEDYCDECYSNYSDDGCDCEECRDGYHQGGLRSWGDTPTLLFHDINGILDTMPDYGKYYMGMEVEVEAGRNHALQFTNMYPNRMWSTTDGSLYHEGTEMVSMPHTFKAWMKDFPWEDWVNLVHSRVPDQSQYISNGVHVHVSRTAFNNKKGMPSAAHLYKFMQFIQIHEQAIWEIAGREGNTYCRWNAERDTLDRMDDVKGTMNPERYRPINTQNHGTIELRFFAGLTDPSFLKRSLQFTHSVVEFTRNQRAYEPRDWQAYKDYVQKNTELYPELSSYMYNHANVLNQCANNSATRYERTIKPVIKEKIRLKKEQREREERERREREARRQEMLNNPPVCECVHCERDRLAALPDDSM